MMNKDLGTGNKDFCQRRETYGAETCDCDGKWPHAPGWRDEETPPYQPSSDPGDFDYVDNVNDENKIELVFSPSAWMAHNMAPDTYQMFTGDAHLDNELGYANEAGLTMIFDDPRYVEMDKSDFTYDSSHFDLDYNHEAIVRDLAQELANWMGEMLFDYGVEADVEMVDTWSPQYYNFETDGFTVRVTVDAAQLREQTLDFDVDEWVQKHYRSYDGFHSFVTGRMHDDEWKSDFDGQFRLESLFAQNDVEKEWITRLAEAEWEIYNEHTTITPNYDRIRSDFIAQYQDEDCDYTPGELTEWAADCLATYQAGMEPLPNI